MDEKLKLSFKRYQYKRKMEDYVIERGYIPFHPPLFEEHDSFSSRNPRITREELVLFLTGKQQILLLRPDITSALMKEIYPIALNEGKCKVFYQSTIYRNKRFEIQEINQFGIENLGDINEITEIELIVMAIDLLSTNPFILEIGHTDFIEGLLRECPISEIQKVDIKRLLYLKNKDELNQMISTFELSSKVKHIFTQIFNLQGKGDQLNALLRSCILNEQMEEAVQKIIRLQEISPSIHIDCSIINELDYYNGIVFKGYYNELNKEVLSGGRYVLISEDSEKRMDAVGFSIDTNAWISCQMGVVK
ncbi:ATP phosphoribosyltransferase regulatory subunit [Bacillus sp. EAC]|uniref:ATP phosphoribosyltransferase regulatory subunit n=1 Tax=Bacillus sp. EAC TaxID=1978338 RepID=UPI000B4462D6|nr:ATP phosphoribosyltransferase regulatory subunit [Bacillus sp. EAC]